MKKKLIIILAVVVAVIIAAVMISVIPRGRNLAQFESLKKPRIVSMADQKMLVVEATGDPNIEGRKAFGLLLRTYFRIKQAPKGSRAPAPRARWPKLIMTPKSEWLGYYGMPLPESVNELPSVKTEPGLKIELTTWRYGDVAEILYVGPYDKEAPTVDTLKQFIENRGYRIAGPHEEEYLKGPGIFSKGNPERYYTIIRYQVEKAESSQVADSTQ